MAHTSAGPLPAWSPPEQEKVLQELVRYYRYSTVGRRITGLVHNFNGPLQVLSFQVELLERKCQEESDALAAVLPADHRAQWEAYGAYRTQKLGQLRTEVHRISEMVQIIIRQGMHEGPQDAQPIDLNQLIEEELEFLQADRFFKHRLKKNIQLGKNLPIISGSYVDFSQSFRNVVENALEAMSDTRAPLLTVVSGRDQGRCFIRVGDNGPGFPGELLPYTFQPFWTTKNLPGHEHAGLGLFMARRLLAPYRGEILIESQPGETWVTLSLP